MCSNFCKWEKAASEIISIFKVSKQRVGPCSLQTASNQRNRFPRQPAVICIVLLCYLMCHRLLVTCLRDIFIVPPAATLCVPSSPVQKSPQLIAARGSHASEPARALSPAVTTMSLFPGTFHTHLTTSLALFLASKYIDFNSHLNSTGGE